LNSKLTEDALPPKPKLDDFKTDAEFEQANSEYTDKKQDHKIKKAVSEGRIEDSENVIKNSQDEINREFSIEMQALVPKRPKDFVPAIEAVGKKSFRTGVAAYLIESEIGPDLAYELHQKPKILESMLDMTPSQAMKLIVKTEEEVIKNLQTRKVSKATTPITPIDSGGGPVGMSEETMGKFNSGKMDDDEWDRLREADIKKKQAQGMNVR